MRILSPVWFVVIACISSGCSYINHVYDEIGPPVQLDHPESEFGLDAAKKFRKEHPLGVEEGTEFSVREPKPLQRGRRTYLVLEVDGGGILGITPSNLVARMETAIQQRAGSSDAKLNDFLSVCSGTSTGAIISGGIVAGVPAQDLADFYRTTGYELFRGKGKLPLRPILQYQLNREAFQEEMLRMLDRSDYSRNVRLGELNRSPSIVIAALDLVSRRTIFFRNREEIDAPLNTKDIQLVDAISASALSAAVYFGKLPAPQIRMKHFTADGLGNEVTGAIFADGGQGTQNSTMALVSREALRILKNDPGSQVVLISLGCGNDYGVRDFSEVLRYRGLDQIIDYVFQNQARRESILMQWISTMEIQEIEDRLRVYRFDWNLTSAKDANPFSVNPKQRDYLLGVADEIGERDDFQSLLNDLSDDRVRITQFQH